MLTFSFGDIVSPCIVDDCNDIYKMDYNTVRIYCDSHQVIMQLYLCLFSRFHTNMGGSFISYVSTHKYESIDCDIKYFICILYDFMSLMFQNQ